MKRLAKLLAVAAMFLVCVQPVDAKSEWKKDNNGWWYEFDDGAYYVDTFAVINNKIYCFDKNGYMATGWQALPWGDGTQMYYFTGSGELGYSQWVGNQWVNWYGQLAKNGWVDNYRYYVDEKGNWDQSKGVRNTAWKKDNNGWWFDLGDGTYAKGGFYEIDRNTYIFDDNGYMRTGWYKDEYGDWYYLGGDGAVRCSQWVDGYYLGLYGVMAQSTWVEDSTVYVDVNGNRAPGWKKDAVGWWLDLGADGYPTNRQVYIDGKIYQFDDKGYMVTGWYSPDNNTTWYFFNSDGSQKTNAWEGNYWLNEYGEMARDQWVDGGKYYVDADGVWVPNKKH